MKSNMSLKSIFGSKNTSVSTEEQNTFYVKGEPFIVSPRYEPIKALGKGAYGTVCAAYDTIDEQKVAIKKVKEVLVNAQDTKRILREVKLLRHFHHPNIIEFIRSKRPKTIKDIDNVYMVLEFMDTDLHRIIVDQQNVLSSMHIKYIVYQLLCAIKALHTSNVIHRDIKPANMLLNNRCVMKLCDFGLARGITASSPNCGIDNQFLTEYVVTRWYRAPEVMCSNQYGRPMDMWSAGCVLAELFCKKPLFPGSNYMEQLDLIFDLLGSPNQSDMKSWIQNPKAFQYVQNLTVKSAKDLRVEFPSASLEAVNLISELLTLNPSKRATVEKALTHPFFREVRNAKKEFDGRNTPFNFEQQQEHLSERELQKLLFDELGGQSDSRDVDIDDEENVSSKQSSRRWIPFSKSLR